MLEVRREKNGELIVTLDFQDALVFQSLPDRLRGLLKDPGMNERATKRLFPLAYGDPEKDREYRRLLGNDLMQRKLESIDVFEKSMGEFKIVEQSFEVLVRPEDFDLCEQGVEFTCGIEGLRDGQPCLVRWAGGLPGGLGHGAPGRLLPLALG